MADPKLLLSIGALVGLVLWLLALFEGPVRRTGAAVITLVAVPLRLAHEACEPACRWLLRHARDAFERAEPASADTWSGWPVIGAFFTASIVLVNLYAEWWLLVLTLPLLGFALTEMALPSEAASLTALAVTSLGLFWGGMLSDCIRLTHISPWARRCQRDRVVMGAASLTVLAAILWSGWQLGRRRGLEMAYEPTAAIGSADLPTSGDSWDPTDPLSADDAVIESAQDATSHVLSPQAAAQEAEYERLSRELPVQTNGLLVVLGFATFAVGKWSFGHVLAYVSGLVFFGLWLTLWVIDFAIRVPLEMLVTLRDILLPQVTNLTHLGTRSVMDFYSSMKDARCQRDAASVQAAAARRLDELSQEVLGRRGEGADNGHSGDQERQGVSS